MQIEDLFFLRDRLPIELFNTLYMVITATFFAVIIGFPLGVLLTLWDSEGVRPHSFYYKSLSLVVDIGRSIPFAILMIAIIPFTRWVVGTSLGTTASIVPLSLAAIPFFARLAEASLKEISKEVIEAALLMGTGLRDLIFKIFIPEALPTLINGVTLTMVNLVGYSAMAGLVGGGGLGKIAIQYGYHRFNGWIMAITLVVIVLVVQGIQRFGDRITYKIKKKRGKVL